MRRRFDRSIRVTPHPTSTTASSTKAMGWPRARAARGARTASAHPAGAPRERAGREMPRARTGMPPRARSRPNDGERPARPARGKAPLATNHDRKGERGSGDRRDCEQPDAEQCRERIVEQAVRDEAVPTRVPEVVPEIETMPEEDRALVHMRGESLPGGPRKTGSRGKRRRWRPIDCLTPECGHAKRAAPDRCISSSVKLGRRLKSSL